MSPSSVTLRQACAAEAVGTFALVFVGTGAIVADALTGSVPHVGIALTFGLVVMAAVYAVGPVSGAHINPAVTVAFWAAGRLPGRRVGPYVASQLAGAAAASTVLRLLAPGAPTLGATVPAGSMGQSFGLELVLTFLLMFVILCVAVGAKEQGLMAGIAIGGAVAVGALAGGPLSGASMNPARSLGPALVGLDLLGRGGVAALASQGLYVVAPVLGALLAVPTYRLVYADRTPLPFTS